MEDKKIPAEKPQEEIKPPRKRSQGVVSGSPDSVGGSREGNIGHQSNPNSGKGHRQV
jgi:hypothetical protein